MKLNENDKLYGFTVKSGKYVKEVDATLFDLTHVKSGARLLFLDRSDDNMTFAIGFRTIPTDDTGVFHIIEHSVLCGSEKFPVKDPFTELLKGSVSTYLNAMTSGDKTLYPVSSKNEKAFHGLVDVYLDAVLNPSVLTNPYIFMQEGHRLEIDGEDRLTLTGVVYNEMKGVYSTADDYADYLISRQVCPNSTYSYDAGGNPDFIPDLTYGELVEAHKKFYHPSNSCLFLDGDVRLDDILPLIDSYLSSYDANDDMVEVNDGDSPLTDVFYNTYPVEEDEDCENKTRLYLCYNTYPHGDRRSLSALSAVTEVLADCNTAPLTRRILDSGLCEGFTFFPTRSYRINSLNAFFTGVKDGKEKELIEVFDKAISEVISEGISSEILTSVLRRREFNMRESDYGSYPAGMVYMRSCIEAAMFGEDPADVLEYEDILSYLYEKVGTDYYSSIIKKVVDSPRATLVLLPDSDFTAKREAELKARLESMAASMTEEEKAELRKENELFRKWQSEPNTPQQLATLPSLTIEDLKIEPRRIPTDVLNVDGCEVVLHPLHTGGIAYAELYFDVSDATEDDLHYVRLFSDMIFEWDTEKSNVTELHNKTRTHLGSLYFSPTPVQRGNESKLYLMLKASCMDSEKENALSVIEEYLYYPLFNNAEVLKKNLKQHYTYSIESICSRGDSYANIRDIAKHSVQGAVTEHLFGYEYHRFIKNLLKSIDEEAPAVLARLEAIKNTYFCKERLTLGLTEADGHEYAKRLVSIVRCGGTSSKPSPVKPLEKINEGVVIPASVSFASRVGDITKIGEGLYTGAFFLIQSIVSLEILWNEIRLKNGAYDTGFFAKEAGTLGCYSYRDPSPLASLEYFARVFEETEAFLDTEPDLLKYIIGVFGARDTVTTPRHDGSVATQRYLSGKTHESIVQRRRECLESTVDGLKQTVKILQNAFRTSTFTVVGPRDELEKIDEIETILDI